MAMKNRQHFAWIGYKTKTKHFKSGKISQGTKTLTQNGNKISCNHTCTKTGDFIQTQVNEKQAAKTENGNASGNVKRKCRFLQVKPTVKSFYLTGV